MKNLYQEKVLLFRIFQYSHGTLRFTGSMVQQNLRDVQDIENQSDSAKISNRLKKFVYDCLWGSERSVFQYFHWFGKQKNHCIIRKDDLNIKWKLHLTLAVGIELQNGLV